MTLHFHHPRQSTCNPSRDLFSCWGNTRGYTSITHISHKYDLVPALLALVSPSSLIMRAYHLIVSRDVPNDPIPRSTGTALAYVWTSWTETDTCKTVQGFFLGYMSKLEAHLSWWHTYSFFPSPVQFGRMLAPTPCHPAPSLFILILWTRKVLILNTMGPCEGAIPLWTSFPCPPLSPLQRFPSKWLTLLSLI